MFLQPFRLGVRVVLLGYVFFFFILFAHVVPSYFPFKNDDFGTFEVDLVGRHVWGILRNVALGFVTKVHNVCMCAFIICGGALLRMMWEGGWECKQYVDCCALDPTPTPTPTSPPIHP